MRAIFIQGQYLVTTIPKGSKNIVVEEMHKTFSFLGEFYSINFTFNTSLLHKTMCMMRASSANGLALKYNRLFWKEAFEFCQRT